MKRVSKEYKDFFSEANKTMSPESVVRAEEKANQIMLCHLKNRPPADGSPQEIRCLIS